jgi:hypothetical protein
VGLAALSLAVPATVLTVSDAQAQTAAQPAAPPITAPMTGTERRQERLDRSAVLRGVHNQPTATAA